MGQVKSYLHRSTAERDEASLSGVRGAEGAWRGLGRGRHLIFREAAVDVAQPRNPQLRVGIIMDDFSAAAFSAEWTIVALRPDSWEQQLRDEALDFVVVESAWAGNAGLWRGKITGPAGSFGRLPGIGCGMPGGRTSGGLLEQGGPAALRGLPSRRETVRPRLHHRRQHASPLPGGPGPQPDFRAALCRAAPHPQPGQAPARLARPGDRLRRNVFCAQVRGPPAADGVPAGSGRGRDRGQAPRL